MPATTPTEVNAAETKPATSPAAQIVDLLSEEGYRPHPQEPDGTFHRIDFKSEGTRFIVRVNEKDPDFVGICIGYLLDEPGPPPETLLRVGHEVQSEAKVAKFFLDPEGKFYEMQAELFLGGHPLNARHLQSCMGALRWAAGRFYEKLQVDAPRAQA